MHMDPFLPNTTNLPHSPKLDELVAFLREKKVFEEEIKAVVETITKTVSAKFYADMITNFSQDEMKELDTITDEAQAAGKVSDLFKNHTGKTQQEVMQTYFDTVAEEVFKEAKIKYTNPV